MRSIVQEYTIDTVLARGNSLIPSVIRGLQEFLSSEGSLSPELVTGKWGKPWETALALRNFLEARGFVEDEYIGKFFTGEKDYEEFRNKTFLHNEPSLFLDKVTVGALQTFLLSAGSACAIKVDGLCGEELMKAISNFVQQYKSGASQI